MLASIEARTIDWDLVTPGESDDDIASNSKYIISIARKLGTTVYCLWEHLRDVNSKFVMTFVGCLKYTAEH